MMYFIKNGTITGYENINLSIFDERQGRWDGDNKDSRSCVFSQQIHLRPDNGVAGYTTNFRNTNSRDYYDVTEIYISQMKKCFPFKWNHYYTSNKLVKQYPTIIYNEKDKKV